MPFLGTHHEYENLGGGRIFSRLHLGAVAYRDGGSLRRIERDWHDSGDPSRPHIVTAAPFFVSVSEDGMRRVHPTREADRYFEVGAPFVKVAGTWTKISLGTPDRTGSLLSWIRTNANIYIQMVGQSVKLGMLLKNGWVPEDRQFAFPVGITGLKRKGNIIEADGVPVMQITRPHVYDLDDPDNWHLLPLEFANLAGQWYTLFTLPAAVDTMSRPFIDPLLQSYAPTVDTFLASGAPTSPQSGSSWLSVRNFSNGAGEQRRTIAKWDLSSIDAGATINSAILSFNNQNTLTNDDNFIACYRLTTDPDNNATWNTYDGSNAWDSAGGDYDGTPTDTIEIIFSNNNNDIGDNCFFDVEGDVQDFVDSVESNYGWLLRYTGNAGENEDGKWDPSSDGTEADRPYLDIDWDAPPAAGYTERGTGRGIMRGVGRGL